MDTFNSSNLQSHHSSTSKNMYPHQPSSSSPTSPSSASSFDHIERGDNYYSNNNLNNYNQNSKYTKRSGTLNTSRSDTLNTLNNTSNHTLNKPLPSPNQSRNINRSNSSSNVLSSSSKKFTMTGYLFLGTSVLTCIICVALEASLLALLISNIDSERSDLGQQGNRTIPTYLAIFIIAFFYSVFLSFYSLREKNIILVIGLFLFNVAMTIYAALQVNEIKSAILEARPWDPGYNYASPAPEDSDPFLHLEQGISVDGLWRKMRPIVILIPIILGITSVISAYLGHRLYREFGWVMFQRLGASTAIRRYYIVQQVFLCFLNFAFFFIFGFSIQLLILNPDAIHVWEIVITAVSIPIILVMVVVARWAVRHEKTYLMVLFDLSIFAGFVYFGIKVWRIFSGPSRDQFSHDRTSLTAFGAISVLLLVCTLLNSIWCNLNFGKGLKRAIFKNKQTGIQMEGNRSSPALDNAATRMAID